MTAPLLALYMFTPRLWNQLPNIIHFGHFRQPHSINPSFSESPFFRTRHFSPHNSDLQHSFSFFFSGHFSFYISFFYFFFVMAHLTPLDARVDDASKRSVKAYQYPRCSKQAVYAEASNLGLHYLITQPFTAATDQQGIGHI